MSFKELNLHPSILQSLEESGYQSPTPIQEQAIPLILEGNDIKASAQTGSGKTAAFLLPAVNRLTVASPVKCHGPRILVLVPTRELAMQVCAQAIKYSKHLHKVKTVCIYGGTPYPLQNKDLSRPYEILVATPGRLIDHMERGKINFGRLEMLVLDEADRMLDMGFIKPVEQIIENTPKNRQTLLFSATLKGSVLNLCKKLLRDPKELSLSPEILSHENIEQRLFQVDNLSHKHQLLDHLLNDPCLNQVIVFTSTKKQANFLVDKLIEKSYDAAALHGDMNQRQRSKTLLRLRQGKIRILVATDVAARGIDIQSISHVINFDLPNGVEDYVHRIGRTGRAGAKGTALSFAEMKDMYVVRDIEKFIGQRMELQTVPGMEPKLKTPAKSFGPKKPFQQKKTFNKERTSRFSREKTPYKTDNDEKVERKPRAKTFQWGRKQEAPR